jgi:hypothetical protein
MLQRTKIRHGKFGVKFVYKMVEERRRAGSKDNIIYIKKKISGGRALFKHE